MLRLSACALIFQAFAVDEGVIPTDALNQQNTESVDFGDVDLDGDWDVGLAEADSQNRIWINLGGLQGGAVGVFQDDTAARLPALFDDTRDIDFVDIDGDGDVDWHTSNTSESFASGDRWLINTGSKEKPGMLGYFIDETASRWLGLGSFPSSVPPESVFSGTFLDWAEDSDFADLDNDGDLDLRHSSSGPYFSGLVPTRIFLNDGDGYFEEFNPSGFAVDYSAFITSGSPGLWCEGLQQSDTSDVSGAFCDVATSAMDVDVGDIDGDYDLDILLGAREEDPRVFANRSSGSALAPGLAGLGFRDVTALAFPTPHTIGQGHYEEELGDLDRDADLDILGVNWEVVVPDFKSVVWRNGGSGVFVESTQVMDFETDEHDGDFIDYDSDGDLDLYLANFHGKDRLYRNDTQSGGAFQFAQVPLPAMWFYSTDLDVCDTDQDGDYDVLVGKVLFQPDVFLRNVTQIPDLSAPSLPRTEALADRSASAGVLPVRTYVYDNAPDYLTWHNDTRLQIAVDGVLLPQAAARGSGGQIFRAELPGDLVGSVSYRFVSTDEHGNTGASAVQSYLSSSVSTFQASYGVGTSGLAGGEPAVAALSIPWAQSTFHLALSSGAPAGTLGLLAIASQPALPGITLPSLLHLNLAGLPLLVQPLALDQNGDGVLALPLGAIPSGAHVYTQGFVRDATAGGEVLASSKGLELVTQ